MQSIFERSKLEKKMVKGDHRIIVEFLSETL